MPTMTFACPSCHVQLSAEPGNTDRVSCPKCGTVLTPAESAAKALSDFPTVSQASFPSSSTPGETTTDGDQPPFSPNTPTVDRPPTLSSDRTLDEPEPLTHRRDTPLPKIPGYEVLGELGRGGMGVVYQAQQVSLKRLVALKMIRAGDSADDEQVSRFRTEAEAVAHLQHPNIVQIHEIGAHQGCPGLIESWS